MSVWIPVSRNGWIGLLLCFLQTTTVAVERGVVVDQDRAGQEMELYAQSHALVIGVSNYQNGWPPLPGVKSDLIAVKGVLQRHGFKVRKLEDLADKNALESAYEEFLFDHGLSQQNRLLFYFAGHGHTQKPPYASDDPEEWTGYIVARDAPSPEKDLQGFIRNAVSMEYFEELAKRIHAKHALFVFDSCFSGTVFALPRALPQSISYKTARPVRQFITSGGANETVPDVSVFRRQFVAALEGEADGNDDRYVTGAELGEFLQNSVINYTRNAQHPQYGKIRHPKLDKGDFVFTLESVPPPLALGYLQVNVTVSGAAVSLNKRRRGTAGPGSPLNLTNLAAGEVRVKVEAQGYKSQEQPTRIRPGQWTKLLFDLEREQMAKLTVRSNVYDDTVYLDDKAVGSTRLELELTPGTYRLRVAKEGWATYEETITLKSGQSAVVPAQLTPDPREAFEPEMVAIKGGCFQMGSPSNEEGRYDIERQHRVCVEDFQIGKYEVTQAQWQAVMGNNPSHFKGCDDCPVENVSWNYVQQYIEKLNRRNGKRYRLPTEAEWEYAARAGTTGPFSFLGKISAEKVNYKANYTYAGSAKGEYRGKTVPVGSLPANPWSLHEVHGNVWEWTCSRYVEDYDGSEKECIDKNDTNARPSVRSGSWWGKPWTVRSANRLSHRPTGDRKSNLGFRLARTF